MSWQCPVCQSQLSAPMSAEQLEAWLPDSYQGEMLRLILRQHSSVREVVDHIYRANVNGGAEWADSFVYNTFARWAPSVLRGTGWRVVNNGRRPKRYSLVPEMRG